MLKGLCGRFPCTFNKKLWSVSKFYKEHRNLRFKITNFSVLASWVSILPRIIGVISMTHILSFQFQFIIITIWHLAIHITHPFLYHLWKKCYMQLYIDFLNKRVHEYWITTKEISSILCILSIDIQPQLSWLIAYSYQKCREINQKLNKKCRRTIHVWLKCRNRTKYADYPECRYPTWSPFHILEP